MPAHPVSDSFQRLGHTLKDIKREKNIFLYLLAFFFFIDGVYTIIEMATAYGSALGLDSTGLLLALLVTQIVAFPFALIFAKCSKKYATDLLIKIWRIRELHCLRFNWISSGSFGFLLFW